MSSLSFTTTACQGWSNPNVNYSNPTINYLSGTYSPAGATTLIAIIGTNFKLYSTIKFGTLTPTMIFISSLQINFYVPTSATPGSYVVQVFNDTYASNIVTYELDNSIGYWSLSTTISEAITNSNNGGLDINGAIRINNSDLSSGGVSIGNLIFTNNTTDDGSFYNQFISWPDYNCSITADINSLTSNAAIFVTGEFDVDGDCYINGVCNANSFNPPSDYRIKDNIVSLHDSDLYSVDNLKPIKYFNKKTEKEEIGFLAHEVQEIFPSLVTGEKDGEELQRLNYMGLIGVLTKEIQLLKAEVAELKKAQTKS
jgi:hypothetical protein